MMNLNIKCILLPSSDENMLIRIRYSDSLSQHIIHSFNSMLTIILTTHYLWCFCLMKFCVAFFQPGIIITSWMHVTAFKSKISFIIFQLQFVVNFIAISCSDGCILKWFGKKSCLFYGMNSLEFIIWFVI